MLDRGKYTQTERRPGRQVADSEEATAAIHSVLKPVTTKAM